MKPVPYIYEIQNDKQLLIYYGSDHSFDPNHKQWADIKELFAKFLEQTKNSPKVVLVEGGGNQLRDSEDQAIKEGGEPLFMTYIANKVGIKTISPEPDEKYEIDELLKTFKKAEIMSYYFTRLADQWNRYAENVRPDFSEYMNKFLKRYEQTTKWADFEFTVDNMKKIHKELTGQDFNETSEQQIHNMIWPTEQFNWIGNKVSLASTKIRNDFIASEIKRYWDEGKSIFIIFGQGHAVEHEEYLKASLK